MSWDARRCGSASGSVTAMTMAKAAPSAPEENHLCPSITHSSPSRTARVRKLVGSDPETSGSVIEKKERISPSTSGFSQRSFCSSVPKRWRISPLPASGAWQFARFALDVPQQQLLPGGGYTPVRGDAATGVFRQKNPLDLTPLNNLDRGYAPVTLAAVVVAR